MFKEIRDKLENILCSILHNSNNWPQVNGKKPTLELRTVCSCELSHFSYVRLCDSMDVAHQFPLFMGFSRQEYWSGLPRPSPGDLPNPEIEPMSPSATSLKADSLLLSHQEIPR